MVDALNDILADHSIFAIQETPPALILATQLI